MSFVLWRSFAQSIAWAPCPQTLQESWSRDSAHDVARRVRPSERTRTRGHCGEVFGPCDELTHAPFERARVDRLQCRALFEQVVAIALFLARDRRVHDHREPH